LEYSMLSLTGIMLSLTGILFSENEKELAFGALVVFT